MAGIRLGAAVGPLRTLMTAGTAGGLTDAQLLDRVAAGGGGTTGPAFAALVERHGAMVLRVCRRVLDDRHDADDAFQATFLVLHRRAGSIRSREALASWLHGVALRSASSLRAKGRRRSGHERRFASASKTSEGTDGPVAAESAEVRRVVHEELDRLPERYRAPVVLCDLEGLSHEQAAGRLGWPVGTVKSRLSRARDRLARRGFAPAAVGPGFWSVPPRSLTDATRSAANGFAAERLAQGVLSMIRMQRLVRIAAALSLVASVAAVGTFLHAQPPTNPRPAEGSGKRVRFETMILTTSGFDWREALDADLNLVDQADGTTVWTLADDGAVNRLLGLTPGGKLLPEVTAVEGQAVSGQSGQEVKYVANLIRHRSADGGVAFTPVVKSLATGLRTELSGRDAPGGILAKGRFEDRQLVSFSTYGVAAERGDGQRIKGQVQVPEVRISRAEGEWLVPEGGALLISLGLRTVKTGYFSTAPPEHLVLIRARSLVGPAVAGADDLRHARPRGN